MLGLRHVIGKLNLGYDGDISLGEALHHFPGLEALNAFGTDFLPLQLALLALGILAYALITWLSFRRACRSFEKIDL